MCLISSDVTGEWKGRVSYGPTAVIDETGSVVRQVELMQEGLIIHELKVGQGAAANHASSELVAQG